MTTFGINDFVRRQTADSEFTHYDGDIADILMMCAERFELRKAGYRDGVCLISVPGKGFFTGIVELEEGDQLVGEYKARREGEEPRKTTRVVKPDAQKLPAQAVDIVLYRRDVLTGRRDIITKKLLEGERDEFTTDCDWEIISINGRPTKDEMPIAPMTLIANHFELDGGTATGMTSEEFETALRESVLFWKNKAMLKGS